jgi:hypothetical protein
VEPQARIWLVPSDDHGTGILAAILFSKEVQRTAFPSAVGGPARNRSLVGTTVTAISSGSSGTHFMWYLLSAICRRFKGLAVGPGSAEAHYWQAYQFAR